MRSAAVATRSAIAPSSSPSSAFTRAAAPLMRPSQWTTGSGIASPETGKLLTALVVSPPQSWSCSDTLMPVLSWSVRVLSPYRQSYPTDTGRFRLAGREVRAGRREVRARWARRPEAPRLQAFGVQNPVEGGQVGGGGLVDLLHAAAPAPAARLTAGLIELAVDLDDHVAVLARAVAVVDGHVLPRSGEDARLVGQRRRVGRLAEIAARVQHG